MLRPPEEVAGSWLGKNIYMYTPETLVPWEAAEGIEAKAGLQFGFQLRIESVGECSGYQQRTWWREERGDAGEPTWGQRVYRSRSLNAKTGVKYRGERDEQWHKYIHLLGLFLLGEERGQLRHAVGVRFFELLDAMGPLGRGLALLVGLCFGAALPLASVCGRL